MAIFRATDIVEMALEIEKGGEIFYRTVAQKAKSPEVQALFEDLAQQEVQHYAAFEKLSQVSWDRSLMPADQWDQYLIYLQATVQSAFFQGQDKALSLAEQVTDEKEALRMAIGFEKETILFFHDLRDMVSDSDKKVITRIVDEEKLHLRRLAEILNRIQAR
ncbi:MAG: rubrerythrin [Ardenticatenales bacterium]|nr:rubrerythrin [Ardenticatenales bacterium]